MLCRRQVWCRVLWISPSARLGSEQSAHKAFRWYQLWCNGSHPVAVHTQQKLKVRCDRIFPMLKSFLQSTVHVLMIQSVPSGKRLHSYWKWPSRNSGFTHCFNGGSFHSFLYVYQRVQTNNQAFPSLARCSSYHLSSRFERSCGSRLNHAEAAG